VFASVESALGQSQILRENNQPTLILCGRCSKLRCRLQKPWLAIIWPSIFSSIIHPPPQSHTIAPPHNNNPPPSSLDINFHRPVDVQRVQRHLWYRYLGFTRNRCAPSCLWASTFSGCDAKPTLTIHPSIPPPCHQPHDGFLQQTIHCLGRSTKIIQVEHDHHVEAVAQGSTKF
jgi:hypothetical protein